MSVLARSRPAGAGAYRANVPGEGEAGFFRLRFRLREGG
jgi:hypothetical protein